MFLSNCNQFTRLAAASAFMALTAVSAPASPDELAEYLGPVGASRGHSDHSRRPTRHSILRARQ